MYSVLPMVGRKWLGLIVGSNNNLDYASVFIPRDRGVTAVDRSGAFAFPISTLSSVLSLGEYFQLLRWGCKWYTDLVLR